MFTGWRSIHRHVYLSQVSHLFMNKVHQQLVAQESAENRSAPVGTDDFSPGKVNIVLPTGAILGSLAYCAYPATITADDKDAWLILYNASTNGTARDVNTNGVNDSIEWKNWFISTHGITNANTLGVMDDGKLGEGMGWIYK